MIRSGSLSVLVALGLLGACTKRGPDAALQREAGVVDGGQREGAAVLELLPNGGLTLDGTEIPDGGAADALARKPDEIIAVTARAEEPWRAVVALVDANRRRLLENGMVLAVRGEPARRTAVIGGKNEPKIRMQRVAPPASGNPRDDAEPTLHHAKPPASGDPPDDGEPTRLLHVELHGDGRIEVDGVAGPLAQRVRDAKAHGIDAAILVTERDTPLTFGAIVDVAREIRDAGIRSLALAIAQPPPPPPPEGLALEASWRTCAKDADCTYATLGCCAVTPVNRRHLAAARTRLAASGLPPCPPKAACGPSAAGTWDGAVGKCRSGVCGQPNAP